MPFPWQTKAADAKPERKSPPKPAPKVEVVEERVEPPNPLIAYFVGGGVMGGILLIGFMANRRR